jgi:hypothetical protein
VQRHPLAIDVADLEARDFTRPKPGAVGDREGNLVLQAAGGSDEARTLLAREHRRQFLRDAYGVHLRHQLGPPERDVEEEPQTDDRRLQ